jgi:hypothetical protein
MQTQPFFAALLSTVLALPTVCAAGEPKQTAHATVQVSVTVVHPVSVTLASSPQPGNAPRATVTREATPEGETVTLNFE